MTPEDFTETVTPFVQAAQYRMPTGVMLTGTLEASGDALTLQIQRYAPDPQRQPRVAVQVTLGGQTHAQQTAQLQQALDELVTTSLTGHLPIVAPETPTPVVARYSDGQRWPLDVS